MAATNSTNETKFRAGDIIMDPSRSTVRLRILEVGGATRGIRVVRCTKSGVFHPLVKDEAGKWISWSEARRYVLRDEASADGHADARAREDILLLKIIALHHRAMAEALDAALRTRASGP